MSIALACACSAACIESAPLELEAVPPELLSADVLLVVDNAGEMTDAQERLAQSISHLVAGLSHYRIAVISTDTSVSNFEQAGPLKSEYSATHPWNLRALDGSECVRTAIEHGCFRGPIVSSDDAVREETITTLAKNVRLGTCGAGGENGFGSLILALDAMKDGGCNAGFLRAEARLIVVFIGNSDVESDVPVSDVLAALERAKPLRDVRLAFIAGFVDGRPAQCGVSSGAACGSLCDEELDPGSGAACTTSQTCPSGEYCAQESCTNEALQYFASCASCSYFHAPDCCVAHPAERFFELARAFDGALIESLCQPSFDETLARIALLAR
jgi:hypothetical protein